jgi:hypothetical protein
VIALTDCRVRHVHYWKLLNQVEPDAPDTSGGSRHGMSKPCVEEWNHVVIHPKQA